MVSGWKLMLYNLCVFEFFFNFNMNIFMVLLDLIFYIFGVCEVRCDVCGEVGIFCSEFIF